MFSLDKHLEDWQRSVGAVALEGPLHEDGEFYVIDPAPDHPGTLLLIRKADVEGGPLKLAGDTVRNGVDELHRVHVKRGAPVMRVRVVRADDLSSDTDVRILLCGESCPRCTSDCQREEGHLGDHVCANRHRWQEAFAFRANAPHVRAKAVVVTRNEDGSTTMRATPLPKRERDSVTPCSVEMNAHTGEIRCANNSCSQTCVLKSRSVPGGTEWYCECE